MYRRTKIVATLGPASDQNNHLEKMIQAGMNVVRINFSHGSPEEHTSRINKVRVLGQQHAVSIGILADLQGPKIRIERFISGSIQLNEGQLFTLDAQHPADAGTTERVGIVYKQLVNDVQVGNTLLLDDGRIALMIENVDASSILCRVLVGGKLSDRKGINLQGGGLSAPALTEKDKIDIVTAAKLGADYLAVSFVKNAVSFAKIAVYFIKKYVDQLLSQSASIDTILLACTHYPLLLDKIKSIVPAGIKIISQGGIVALSLVDYLQRHPEMENRISKKAGRLFYTTDSAVDFNRQATKFYGAAVKSEQVHL